MNPTDTILQNNQSEEWTGFQEHAPYGAAYDLRTDFVMVYGIDPGLKERIAAWKAHGYTIHLMTGVAWGEYQDYLHGRFDGREHWDESQTDRSGKPILHGSSVDIPYMMPTIAYSEYLAAFIRQAVDCGVEAIHLEEPEFWVDGGYSEAFKREWELYYHEPWQAPHSSPDAQYRASKLKAYLYTRTLDRLCSQMKEYAAVKYHRQLRFYVPTHSLINYTQWRIVSPEAKLIDIPGCDGVIGQVWTGTARTPNVYRGVRAERTFETAFLEYGVLQELVRGTGREVWFLHDPIEDEPNRTWSDYRTNYFATVAASLLHPDVGKYEVCPWPRRVFEGQYPADEGTGRCGISDDYAATLLAIIHMLQDIHRYPAEPGVETSGIGLLLANSAMYQRGAYRTDSGFDSFKYDGVTAMNTELPQELRDLLDWSGFFGMALPLVKHGIPLRPVQLDNLLRFPGYLDDYRVLLLSYEFMKPEHPGIHQALAQWVRDGGVLIYAGDGSDPFHQVREWWNQGRKVYARAENHLFATLGLEEEPRAGEYRVGRGGLIVIRTNPACFAGSVAGAETVRGAVRQALVLRGEADTYREQNHLRIRRGPYLITSMLWESCSASPLTLEGRFIDLCVAGLPVCQQKLLAPGENSLLYDLNWGKQAEPGVVASSSRITIRRSLERELVFLSEAPQKINVFTRIALPAPALEVTDETGSLLSREWDPVSKTLLVQYPGVPAGKTVTVRW